MNIFELEDRLANRAGLEPSEGFRARVLRAAESRDRHQTSWSRNRLAAAAGVLLVMNLSIVVSSQSRFSSTSARPDQLRERVRLVEVLEANGEMP